MDEIKKKVEALLFSSGRIMNFEELKRLCRVYDDEKLKKALQDLKVDYDNRDSSLKLINEEDKWKITTKEDYIGVVKKVVTETELSKSLMETLAVIAWKYPIKQCDLIKVRTNKAYDHLSQLEQMGYISRQKHGRTKLIKLTDKFFAYFDLPPEKLKERFADFNQISQAIVGKEKEIEEMKHEHKKQIEESKKLQEEDEAQEKEKLAKAEKEVDLLDKEGKKVPLKEYEPGPEPEKPELETYETSEKPAEEVKEEAPKPEKEEKTEETPDEEPKEEAVEEKSEPEAEESKPVPRDPEVEAEMDKKAEEIVEQMIHPVAEGEKKEESTEPESQKPAETSEEAPEEPEQEPKKEQEQNQV